MPQKAYERWFCHVMAFEFYFEMPRIWRFSFSVSFFCPRYQLIFSHQGNYKSFWEPHQHWYDHGHTGGGWVNKELSYLIMRLKDGKLSAKFKRRVENTLEGLFSFRLVISLTIPNPQTIPFASIDQALSVCVVLEHLCTWSSWRRREAVKRQWWCFLSLYIVLTENNFCKHIIIASLKYSWNLVHCPGGNRSGSVYWQKACAEGKYPFPVQLFGVISSLCL